LVKILTKSKHCPLRLSPDEENPDFDGDDEVAVEEDEEPEDDVGHDHVDVHEHHGSGAGEIHFPIFYIFLCGLPLKSGKPQGLLLLQAEGTSSEFLL
jgi:hypothetical protein